jgi:transcriptional regulator with XRE-family HTH domain
VTEADKPAGKSFGRRVRTAQEFTGRSTADIAQALGLSTKSVLRMLRGERKPRPGEISELAQFLQVSEPFLLGDRDLTHEYAGPVREAIDLITDLRNRLETTRRLLVTALGDARDEGGGQQDA